MAVAQSRVIRILYLCCVVFVLFIWLEFEVILIGLVLHHWQFQWFHYEYSAVLQCYEQQQPGQYWRWQCCYNFLRPNECLSSSKQSKRRRVFESKKKKNREKIVIFCGFNFSVFLPLLLLLLLLLLGCCFTNTIFIYLLYIKFIFIHVFVFTYFFCCCFCFFYLLLCSIPSFIHDELWFGGQPQYLWCCCVSLPIPIPFHFICICISFFFYLFLYLFYEIYRLIDIYNH